MMPPLADAQRHHLTQLARAYETQLARHGYDGVLLYSGCAHRHFADDQHASFATYGHFLHWVPLAGLEHSWLLIRPGHKPRLFFHAPRDFWHLPPRLPEAPWVDAFEVVTREEREAPRLPAGRFAVLGEVSAAQAERLGAEANPEALTRALDELRVRKSDYEVACLREANRRALAGHAAARDAFLAGGAELDCQLAYLKAARIRESELPYQSIVGINAHGGVLHYQHYDLEAPARAHSLLVDGGHRFRGYCADITRSWAGPAASDDYRALLAGMDHLQRQLVEALAPGVSYVAMQEQMHQGLAELLVAHGLVKASAEAAVERGITRAFCPHGLGHQLGLQVHDVGGRQDEQGRPLPPPPTHPALRLTRELEAGMAITVEPGLYVIPMLLEPLRQGATAGLLDWARVEALGAHGGIRIEDNVLITPTGRDNLTRDLETTP
ncbi:Xaa-Pro dipeptidase [Halomonas sp. NCCP-2165]|nr:Xaa-Pro dipeptidase [Halomonas sp. NCCP-2165]GKW50113.1 Xaa-Pro dipeptidase [Halomonas sp. NCCP-2165]